MCKRERERMCEREREGVCVCVCVCVRERERECVREREGVCVYMCVCVCDRRTGDGVVYCTPPPLPLDVVVGKALRGVRPGAVEMTVISSTTFVFLRRVNQCSLRC